MSFIIGRVVEKEIIKIDDVCALMPMSRGQTGQHDSPQRRTDTGPTMNTVRAIAPGRVNLIGDHTDYTGGLCLPMAINLNTVIEGHATTEDYVELTSEHQSDIAQVRVDIDEPASTKGWTRYVAGVVHQMKLSNGFLGHVSSTVPLGAGLSSSASFEVALALALGHSGSIMDLALLCQRAEQVASGVPCGILDQLSSAGGREGKAMIMDCHDLSLTYVDVPDNADIVVVHSGQERGLVDSEYAQRVAQCAAAERVIGPLRTATLEAAAEIDDAVVARRAKHVISENQRVRDFAVAFANGDLQQAGALMNQSHQSLRDDYETSTPIVDALIAELVGTSGVYGARITGGGFGGCVVALTRPGALQVGWRVRPAAGAHLA
jgi:galactokinase